MTPRSIGGRAAVAHARAGNAASRSRLCVQPASMPASICGATGARPTAVACTVSVASNTRVMVTSRCAGCGVRALAVMGASLLLFQRRQIGEPGLEVLADHLVHVLIGASGVGATKI